MNKEKIVNTLSRKILLPELFAFLSFKEHTLVYLRTTFNIFSSNAAKQDTTMSNDKESACKCY